MKHLTDSWIYEDSRQRATRVVQRLRDNAEREAMRLPKRLAALKFYISRFTRNRQGGN